MEETNEVEDTASSRRRTVLKHSALGIAGALGSSTLGAASSPSGSSSRDPGDNGRRGNPNDEFTERLQATDREEIYEALSAEYGSEVARFGLELWDRYVEYVENGWMTEEAALDRIFSELSDVSGDLEADLRTYRNRSPDRFTSAAQRKLANGTLELSESAVTTQDDEILLTSGDVGGSGVVGFRDSHAYPGQNKLQSITSVPGIGAVSQWAWLEGAEYVSEGGTYDITVDYFHNGLNGGGSAQYDVFIQEEGERAKSFKTFRNVGGPVYGNEERFVQHTFSSDTSYIIGVRLKTSCSGIAKAISDYQTINGDGSVRHLEINSISMEKV